MTVRQIERDRADDHDERKVFDVLNVRSKSIRDDAKPLDEACRCHACSNFSRAYIYHLFKAHELLGEVLLYSHNQWQLFELFRIARAAISQGHFDSWMERLLYSQLSLSQSSI
jgi:queuine tRNA-ribosyltransferase